MRTYTAGSEVGSGTYCCEGCGYIVALDGPIDLPQCFSCNGSTYYRPSMFLDEATRPMKTPEFEEDDLPIGSIRESLGAGQYLVIDADGDITTLPLESECTHIGRGLTADLQLDDPSVSRRHAVIQRHGEWFSILDDRSLNGVFVDNEKIQRSRLSDGDEIVVGRFKLIFLDNGGKAPPNSGDQADQTQISVSV